jgi:hypothetical protein
MEGTKTIKREIKANTPCEIINLRLPHQVLRDDGQKEVIRGGDMAVV